MSELHAPPQEIFPAPVLLFPWSLTFLKILEPRIHSGMGSGWSYQEQGLRSPGLPSNPHLSAGIWETSFFGPECQVWGR